MTSPTRTLQAANEGRLDLEVIVAALSARFSVVTGPKTSVRRARLDTFDRRLLAAGLRLEYQVVASGRLLVLEGTDTAVSVAVPASDLRWPARADVLPAGRVREVIAPVAGIRALMVTSQETRRRRRLELLNDDGKTVARAELDEPASGATGPAQLTVRTLRGYDDQARRAAGLLVGVGLRAVEHGGAREPDSAPEPDVADRAAPAILLLATALSGFLATMRENLPGLLDDVDTEFLHDFRVAIRRTRSTLKLGRAVLPQVMRSRWEPVFKGFGDMTTPVRDLDVYELDLPTMAGWLVAANRADLEPFAAHLRTRRAAERRVLVRELRSARFGRLLRQWGEELTRLSEATDDSGRERLSAGTWADRSISRAYRQVVRGGAAICAESPATDVHALRKRCKELRYAIEVGAPVVASGPRKRAVADLKGLQDVLGRFQDCQVQSHALRGFAEAMMADGTPASAMLAMGELIAHLDAEQDRARRQFDGTFARFARPASQQMMDQLGGAGR